MNTRISFNEGCVYLQSLGDFAGLHVGTCYDTDYLSKFPDVAPAVWFAGQQSTKMDDGRGFSGLARQNMRVDLAMRVCVARFREGVYNAEDALEELVNKTTDAIYGWTIPGARDHFVLERTKDGLTFQSIIVADLVFSATFTFNKQA